jgi:peptidase M50B-like protein
MISVVALRGECGPTNDSVRPCETVGSSDAAAIVKYRTCVHEIGHALVAIAFGRTLRSVRIYEDSAGDTAA